MQYDVTTNPRWRTEAIFKIVCRYISVAHCPINAIFRHRLYDQSSKFRKFKFADGCHFENFWWNLVCRCEFWFRGWSLVMWQFFLQIQAGRWNHLENRFSAISRRCCVRLTQNLQGRSRISVVHTFRVPIECSYRCLNFLVFYDCVDFAFSILAWIWALNSESY